MRLEHDGLGQMELPDDVYYGIVTERNRRAFDVGPRTINDYYAYPKAVALIKIACARTNREIGALDPVKAEAIEKAAWELVEGKFKGQFPVNIYRGAGTPVNMTVNEVIAHRANEILDGRKDSGTVHPNTHVNMCQSTNDVSPTAKEMVVYECLGELIAHGEHLADVLAAKAEEFKDVIKMGRTCLQDAVPLTLGMEFSVYHDSVRRVVERLKVERKRWNKSCLGGTAVGTCMSCLPGFRDKIVKHLSEVCGREMQQDENLLDGMTSCDGLIIAHGQVEALAVAVWKIARDLRLMCSGPRTGFGEIVLPPVAPGSSIMPGKVNPVIPEMIFLTSDQVVANHQALVAGLMSGWLELGTSSSLPIKSMIESCDLLGRSMKVFADKCIAGTTANRERCLSMVEKSTSLATMVSTLFGYEVGTKVAHLAMDENITCKEAAKRLQILPDEVIEELFDLPSLVDADKMEAMFKKFAKYRKV